MAVQVECARFLQVMGVVWLLRRQPLLLSQMLFCSDFIKLKRAQTSLNRVSTALRKRRKTARINKTCKMAVEDLDYIDEVSCLVCGA